MNGTMSTIAGVVAEFLAEEKRMPRTRRIAGLYEVRRPYAGENVVEVVYRGTVVATVTNDGVVLNTGGWHTVTTKNVMNAALLGANANARVYQKNYTWYVGHDEYTDGYLAA